MRHFGEGCGIEHEIRLPDTGVQTSAPLLHKIAVVERKALKTADRRAAHAAFPHTYQQHLWTSPTWTIRGEAGPAMRAEGASDAFAVGLNALIGPAYPLLNSSARAIRPM